jgi:PAS domain S-box-containing protein
LTIAPPPIRDKQGRVVGAVLVFRDVTERRRVEAALRAERARLHATVTCIGDAVIVTDAEDLVTLMNPVAQTLTGWKEEAVGRPLAEVFHIVKEQTRQRIESPVNKVIREDTVIGLANHTALVAQDGRVRLIDDSAAPIKNEQGETVGVVLVFRDVTERKQQEEALRAGEQRWRTLAEALPNLVWTDSPDGQCDWLSSQWGKYTGIPENELLGLRWLETVVHPDDRERTLASWQATCADKADYDLEYRIPRADVSVRSRGVRACSSLP